MSPKPPKLVRIALSILVSSVPFLFLASCGGKDQAATQPAADAPSEVTVGVVKVSKHSLERQLKLSSELVPFQEIDVYAKESGYISQLLVDYGTHVKKGQLMAVLEIPELQATVRQDEAAVNSMEDQVTHARNQLSRIEAQRKVLHLAYQRISGVAQAKPGLVAQQEVDDVEGRDLASAAQVEAAKSSLSAAQSNLRGAQSKLEHDKAIYAYSRITAPFSGVVTKRYANLGMLIQAGTNSSTQAMPLVKLSQESLFRLVIPVPESYVGYIKAGDPVDVRLPTLNKEVEGKVARFSFAVGDQTRTMHTEVDVPNPKGDLFPGVYAVATLTLNQSPNALTAPIAAVQRQGDHASAYVVGPDNTVQVRQVQVGIEGENDVQILSGLSDGDEVVVGDRSSLKPGQHVHPQLTTPLTYQSQS
ncbi:MAG TPA: efflux RND transporter periplasmic adaptor subunit [Bryobacteraceae bacterium]|nr:efflux RND transporter periplasmic adaptor subunit [Bryobacteraceae bacterium]